MWITGGTFLQSFYWNSSRVHSRNLLPYINRRNEVLKMQGEQAAKMKDLEDQLLNKISSVQGNILDDDSVIKTLERIKGEAKQLNLAIEQTKEILEEVKTVSNLYVPLAAVMTAVYFSLEGLSDIYFLYQYSLQVFLVIVPLVSCMLNH